MALSISLITQALKTLERVFRGAGDSDQAVATARVQNYVEKVGMASKKELLSRLHRHMTAETLDRILFVMVEIGYFRTVMVGSILYYQRPPTINSAQTQNLNVIQGGKKP